MAISDALYRLIGKRPASCPNETDILAYSEDRLSQSRQARLERHFAECDDCREILAFIGRGLDYTEGHPSDAHVTSQTERILGYVRNDEINRRAGTTRVVPRQISYARLATLGLVLCAIAAAAVFLITRPQPASEAAMQVAMLAVKDGRYTQARISGFSVYSPYRPPTRGADRGIEVNNDDNLNFERALLKLKSAQQESAPVQDRLALARIYLARGDSASAKQGLAILEQLAARGVQTPEALNDTGVAHYLLGDDDKAIDYFNKALATSPRLEEALFNRALAEERARRYDDARRDWERFLDHSTYENWKNEAKAHLNNLSGAGER